jgi:hypothetical protein
MNNGQQVRPSDNPEFQSEEGRNDDVRFVDNNRSPSSEPDYTRTAADLPPGENPPTTMADGGTASNGDEASQYKSSPGQWTDSWLIQRAQEIYSSSTDYMDANITNKWETNLAHFNNEHAPGSSVGGNNLKRSRVFRPKTRSMTKAQESALATALFSTEKVAVVRAENSRNPAQVLSAEINSAILQYRLKKRMPWFQTTIGQFQATKVYGLCISHQYWRYEVDTDIMPAYADNGSLIMDQEGNPLGTKEQTVRYDELCCDGVAPENFRFDPMCDWRNPAKDSPYIVYMMPTYAGEALERMETIDPKTGRPMWKQHSLGAILGTRRQDYDRTRQAREGRERIDPADEQHGNSFTTVWAHMNIIKQNGTDYVYWTMGTELVLTDPVPLTELYPHLEVGERPFVVGFSTIEAFRNYPAGDVELSGGLQEEINTLVNQRLDNVKLVLNKRYYVKRGAQVDLEALMRNTAGGGVMMNDPEKDVKTVDTNDVTSSSYIEQDRLAGEFDDLVGSFTPSQVNQGKGAAQTDGGLEQLSSKAGSVQDYGIHIFNETWTEPVLRQLVKLIQMYETDEVVLMHAADQAQLMQRFGTDEITDMMLRQGLTVNVDVGMGNTDPVRRVERLLFGVEKAVQIPGMVDRVKGPQITDEIFASLGYRDSGRFFLTDQEYEAKIQESPPQENPEIQIKREELQIRKEDNAARDAREIAKNQQDGEIRMRDIAAREGVSMEQMYTQLKIADDSNQTMRQTTAVNANNKVAELSVKRKTGSGI